MEIRPKIINDNTGAGIKASVEKKQKPPGEKFTRSAPKDPVLSSMKNLANAASMAKSNKAKPAVLRPSSIPGLTDIRDSKGLDLTYLKTSYDRKNGITYANVSRDGKEHHLAAFDKKGKLKWCVASEKIDGQIKFDNKGNVSYLNGNTIHFHGEKGEEKWKMDLGPSITPDFKRSDPAIGPDETVYITMENHKPKRSLFGLKKRKANMKLSAIKNGEEQWNYKFQGEEYRLYNPHVNAHGDIFLNIDAPRGVTGLLNDGHILAIKPNGKKRFDKKIGYRPVGTDARYAQSPDGDIYFNHSGKSIAILSKRGKVKGELTMKAPLGDPFFTLREPVFDKKGNVYLVGEGFRGNYMFCLDKENKPKWAARLDRKMGVPMLNNKEDRVSVGLGVTASGIATFKTEDGTLHRHVRPKTGSTFMGKVATDDQGSVFVRTEDFQYVHIAPPPERDSMGEYLDSLADGAAENKPKPKVVVKDDSIVIDGVTLEVNRG